MKLTRTVVGLIGLGVGMGVLALGLYLFQGASVWLSSLPDRTVGAITVVLNLASVGSLGAAALVNAARKRRNAAE